MTTFTHTDISDTSATRAVDLGAEFDISAVEVVNRYCGDKADALQCMCRLSKATVDLLDSSDNVVGTYVFGDTCGDTNPSIDFGICTDVSSGQM